MARLTSLFHSSIGKKVFMAITGLALVGFVVAHLGGNLLIYLGQDQLNAYGYKLKSQPVFSLLWLARAGLLSIVLYHTYTGIMLTLQNRAARQYAYKKKTTLYASVGGRTMILSGLVILCFAIYHILHFTLIVADPSLQHLVDAQGRHDIYSMVVLGFQNKLISFFYIISMIFLWLHVGHGASSVWQSLGMRFQKYRWLTDRIGPAIATFLLIGNASIPLSVMLGIIQLP